MRIVIIQILVNNLNYCILKVTNAHAIMPQVDQDTKEIAKSIITYQIIALAIIVTILGLLLFLTFKRNNAMNDLNYTNASISMVNI